MNFHLESLVRGLARHFQPAGRPRRASSKERLLAAARKVREQVGAIGATLRRGLGSGTARVLLAAIAFSGALVLLFKLTDFDSWMAQLLSGPGSVGPETKLSPAPQAQPSSVEPGAGGLTRSPASQGTTTAAAGGASETSTQTTPPALTAEAVPEMASANQPGYSSQPAEARPFNPPTLPRNCKVLKDYTPERWKDDFIGPANPGTWIVHVADGGSSETIADTIIATFQKRMPSVVFRSLWTANQKGGTVRLKIALALGLPDRSSAEVIVWLARNCGIARDAFLYQMP